MLGTQEYCIEPRQTRSRNASRTTYLVGEVPHRDTHTPLDVHARLHDGLVVLLLLRQVRLRRGRRHPDIEFRDRDLQPQRRELLQDGLEAAGDLPDDEVALEADAVERHAGREELLDEVEHGCRLGARLLDVVVVDVQLRVRVRRARRLERDRDVGRAERVVEDVRAPRTVVVERLVHDVPGVCAYSQSCHKVTCGGRGHAQT